jgi:molybdate transport system substrate-binding protein
MWCQATSLQARPLKLSAVGADMGRLEMLNHCLLTAVALVMVVSDGKAVAVDVPKVAAAADLQFALSEVAEKFRAAVGGEVKLTFGSSGNLFRQIQEGAPFELYLSADEQFVVELAAQGLTENEGDLYARGRIVLFAPHGSPLKVDAELADLKAALADGRVTKFAIANPEHAPYGRRAEEALRRAGLWEAIENKLVLGENVAQAVQFATTGGAQGGIIAYSLALSPSVSNLGTYSLVPEGWHEPLRQRMVLLKDAGETAGRFYAFLMGNEAREIMHRYGFVLPGEPR